MPLELDVVTVKISPQYHVIFDDMFGTVHSLPADEVLDKQWTRIFNLGRECFLDVDFDNHGNPIVPTMSDIIRAYLDKKNRRQIFEPPTGIERGEYGEVGMQTRYEQS